MDFLNIEEELFAEDDSHYAHTQSVERPAQPIPRQPIWLTKHISTLYIEHCIDIPEYPTTHPEGYTYCIDIQNLSNLELEFQKNVPFRLHQSLQYSTDRKYGPHTTSAVYLGDIRAAKLVKQCSGIKHCQYITDEIRTRQHTECNEEEWAFMEKSRTTIESSEPDTRRKHANAFIHALRKRWGNGKACKPSMRESCVLIFHESTTPDITGHYQCWLQCTNFHTQFAPLHFFQLLPYNGPNDIARVRELVQNQPNIQPTECSAYEANWIRRPKCGVDHPQGEGNMIHQECPVQVTWIVPYNLKETPYVLLTCVGTHNHPLTPPNKLVKNIAIEIYELITRINDPLLTSAKFRIHPLVKEWKELQNVQSIEQIHNALNTTSRLDAMIRKIRTVWWPNGRDINTVVFMMEEDRKRGRTTYIRDIKFWGNDEWVVACFYDEQAFVWQNLKAFEIDMTHKRIRNTEINEILFTIEGMHGHVFCLGRAYVNSQTTETYRQVFHTMMRALARTLNVRFMPWAHLHNNEGFHCVKMDQNGKQYAGLGHFLQDIDPAKRDWRWHLKHVLMLCRVHFFRKIDEKLGDNPDLNIWRNSMKSLIDVQTYEDYYGILEILKGSGVTAVREWAINKSNNVIASAICPGLSAMHKDIWYQERPDTNSNEQTGWKTQSLGKALDFPSAIEIGREVDERDINQWTGRTKYGIWTYAKDNSLQARQQRMLAKSQAEKIQRLAERRRRKRRRDEDEDDDIESELDAYLDNQSTGSRRSSNSRSRIVRRGSSRSASGSARSGVRASVQTPHAQVFPVPSSPFVPMPNMPFTLPPNIPLIPTSSTDQRTIMAPPQLPSPSPQGFYNPQTFYTAEGSEISSHGLRVQAVQNAHNTSQFWAEQQNKINIDRQKLELQAAAQKLEMQELDILERRRALQGT